MASNGGSDPFVLDDPMDLGLPVDDEKIAEEFRIRNEILAGYFRDDYPQHTPVESWAGFLTTACDYCGQRWPCEYARAHGL